MAGKLSPTSEPVAVADAGALQPFVRVADIGVGDMVEKSCYGVSAREPVADFEGFPEQKVAAEFLPVDLGGLFFPVVERSAKAEIDEP